MTLFQRLGIGLNIALDSFKLLWQYKHLLIYPLIPALTGVAIQVIIQYVVAKPYFMTPSLDEALQTLVHTVQEPDTAVYTILSFLASFVAMFVFIFFHAALIYHAAHIIRTHDINISRSLNFCLSKWWVLLQWATLSVIVITILKAPEAFIATMLQSMNIAMVIDTLLVTVWSIATFLVIPFIILDNLDVMHALGVSWVMVKTYVWEVVGGLFLISLAAAVLGIITLPLHILLLTQGYVLALVVMSIDVVVVAVVSAGRAVFKAKLYDTYYEKPMEDVARTLQEWEY